MPIATLDPQLLERAKFELVNYTDGKVVLWVSFAAGTTDTQIDQLEAALKPEPQMVSKNAVNEYSATKKPQAEGPVKLLVQGQEQVANIAAQLEAANIKITRDLNKFRGSPMFNVMERVYSPISTTGRGCA